MVELADAEKRVAYDSDDQSSSDDEPEQKEVEVTFEPGKTHRRKSSIDVLHVAMPLFHKNAQETDCIVHKVLESQKHAEDAIESEDPEKAAHTHKPPPSSSHYKYEGAHPDSLATVQEKPDGASSSSNTPGPSGADGTADHGNRDLGGLGQADEQAWKNEMLHSIISCNDVEAVDAPCKSAQEALHSRLLTKKQLSDMAWGVRELSRRLSSIRLKPKVRSLFILTKIYDGDLVPRTREVVQWLLSPERERRLTVYVEDRLKDDKGFDVEGIISGASEAYAAKNGLELSAARDKVSKQLRYWDAELCRSKPHTFDFIVTLGGDGTVLYASWLFQGIVPPVISFSLGSLGFMTKFDFSEFDSTLTAAFLQGVTVSLRLRFEGTIMRSVRKSREQGGGDGVAAEDVQRGRDLVEELVGEEMGDERTHRPDRTYHVLNEIVVDRGPNPTLSNMELFGDDEHLTSILADGICVSTPTGSTAYNLAAGGSLCHPENPIMLVTAIAPHTLSFRPIILPDTIVLRAGVPYDSRTSSWASFDGRERVELHPGDYVTISASRYPFASVQSGGRRSEDWVGSISGKLGWNRRQKQKGGFKEWDKK